jgi:hypothetical protein
MMERFSHKHFGPCGTSFPLVRNIPTFVLSFPQTDVIRGRAAFTVNQFRDQMLYDDSIFV